MMAYTISPDIPISPVGFGPNSPFLCDTEIKTGISPITLTTCMLIAAICIPIQLLELGEEIGWREYLLPKQIAEYGTIIPRKKQTPNTKNRYILICTLLSLIILYSLFFLFDMLYFSYVTFVGIYN